MRGKTFNNIAQRTIKALSQVYGTSVQKYTEPRIKEMIQHRFENLFDEYWWPQFLGSNAYALDGTLGVVTSDLSSIVKRYEDIEAVYREGIARPLAELPRHVNRSTVTGNTARFIEPYNLATKVFKVVPYASTGNVVVTYRTMPDSFADDDIVDFDDWVLIFGAAADFAADDGANDLQVQKFSTKYEERLEYLTMTLNKQRIPLNYREQQSVDDWTEWRS